MARVETRSTPDLREEFKRRFDKESDLFLRRGMSAITVDLGSSKNLYTFGEYLTSGFAGVMHANHISLADALVEALKAQRIKGITDGAVDNIDLVIAKSLKEGLQGADNKKYFGFAEEFLRDCGVNMDLAITTENDLKVRRLKRSKKDAEQAYFDGAPYAKTVLSVFPEGSLKGGRTNAITGKMNGMKMVRSENLETRYINTLLDKDVEVVILPTANIGTQHLLSPDTSLPADEVLPYVLGYESMFPSEVSVRLVVGEPVVFYPGKKVDGKDLMRMTADLLPPEYRGAYAA